MADTAVHGNEVKIEDAGPSRKKISITIPAETISDKLDAEIDALTANVRLPGFRPGRAPRRLVERKFGDALRGEARTSLISEAYQGAIEENKLQVLGEPDTSAIEGLELETGKAFSFVVEVEVLPEFDLPPLDGIEVLRPEITVEDAQVNEEIEKLRINEGELEQRDTPEPGDYLTGRGIMTGPDGTEFHNIDGAVVQIPTPDKAPRGMILGIVVDDFADQLGLPKPGETVTVTAVGPENHEVESVRGAQLTMTFAVERVDRIIPAEPEALVARYGMKDAAQLEQVIRARLEERAHAEQRSLMRRQVSRHLAESAEMELPEQITANQAARNLDRARMELMYRGLGPAEVEEHIAEMRTNSLDDARQELKLFFLLNKAAEDLEIRVEEAEINGQIAQMAMQRGVRPEKLRDELVKTNRIQTVYMQMREHKTLDAILDKAGVKDVSIDEFNAAMGDVPAAKTSKKTSKKPASKKTTSKKTTTKKTSKKSG